MAVVGSLWIKLGLTDADFVRSLKNAEKHLNQFSGRMTSLGSKMIQGFSIPMGLAGGAALKFGMDAVESENLFTVSMGNMADSARAWSEGLRKSLGLNAYDLRRQVGLYNNMAEASGIADKASFDLSKGITKLGHDFASFFNVASAESLKDLEAIFTGQTEPLRKYGIILLETNTKQWALNHGLIKQGQEMTQAQKIIARYNLVLEQSKNAQGDLARTMDSPANKLRIMQEQFKNIAIDLGVALLPAFIKFMDAMKPLVKSLSDGVQWFVKLPEPIKNAAIGMTALSIATGPALYGIGKVSGGISGIVGLMRMLPTLKVVGAFKDIAFSIASVRGGAATGAEALGFLAKSFTPFLVGGAIIAGVTVLAHFMMQLSENARLANLEIGKTNDLIDLTKIKDVTEREIQRFENMKKAASTKNDTKGGWVAGGIGSFSKEEQKKLDDLNEKLKKIKTRIEEIKKTEKTPDFSANINKDLKQFLDQLNSLNPDIGGPKIAEIYKSFNDEMNQSVQLTSLFGTSMEQLSGDQLSIITGKMQELIKAGADINSLEFQQLIGQYKEIKDWSDNVANSTKRQEESFDSLLSAEKRKVDLDKQAKESVSVLWEAQSYLNEQMGNSIPQWQEIVNKLYIAAALTPGLADEFYRLADQIEQTGKQSDTLNSVTESISEIGNTFGGSWGENINKIVDGYKKIQANVKKINELSQSNTDESEKQLSQISSTLGALGAVLAIYMAIVKIMDKIFPSKPWAPKIDTEAFKESLNKLQEMIKNTKMVVSITPTVINAQEFASGAAIGFSKWFDKTYEKQRQEIAKLSDPDERSRQMYNLRIKALAEYKKLYADIGKINASKEFIDRFMAIADQINQGIAGAFSGGIKSFLEGKTDWAQGLKDGVKSAILDGIVEAFMQGTIIKGAMGGMLGQLTDLLAQGKYTEAGGIVGQISASIPGLIETISTLLGPLKDTLGPLFNSTSDSLDGLSSAADKAAESILNAPKGFKIEKYRFEAAQAYQVPEMATGGYVPPTPGGRLVRLAEGGEGEWVVPSSKMGGGGGVSIQSMTVIANNAEEFMSSMDDLSKRKGVVGGTNMFIGRQRLGVGGATV